MRDYNIYEVEEILKSADSSQLRSTGHVLDKWFERDFSLDYISYCLLNEIPLGINKTNENRFLLIYPHNKKKSKDFYL